MSKPNGATAEGTRRYAARLQPRHGSRAFPLAASGSACRPSGWVPISAIGMSARTGCTRSRSDERSSLGAM